MIKFVTCFSTRLVSFFETRVIEYQTGALIWQKIDSFCLDVRRVGIAHLAMLASSPSTCHQPNPGLADSFFGLFSSDSFCRWSILSSRFDFVEQCLGGIFSTDQIRILFTPFGSEFTTEGPGENGLGEVVDAGLCILEPLFDAVDDLGLFFYLSEDQVCMI